MHGVLIWVAAPVSTPIVALRSCLLPVPKPTRLKTLSSSARNSILVFFRIGKVRVTDICSFKLRNRRSFGFNRVSFWMAEAAATRQFNALIRD